MPRSASLFGAVVVVLCLLPLSVEGQAREHDSLRVLVTMEIAVGTEAPVEITAPVGRMITFDNTDYGVKVGLRAVRIDPDTQDVEVEVVGLEGKRGEFTTTGRIDSSRTALGERRGVVAAGVLLEIAVTRLTTVMERNQSSTSDDATGSVRAALRPDLEGDGCCVTCGSTQACGCSVSSSCGSCNGNC